MKVLLLDERYPPELLSSFDVVREPQEDVVAALTTGKRRVGEELFAQLPSLRVVGTATVGFDHIDLAAAEQHGIAVVSVPDYCTQEVADHTLALLYALLRGIVSLHRHVVAGGWSPKAAGPLRTLAEEGSAVRSRPVSLRSAPKCGRTTFSRSNGAACGWSSSTSCSPSAMPSPCTCR